MAQDNFFLDATVNRMFGTIPLHVESRYNMAMIEVRMGYPVNSLAIGAAQFYSQGEVEIIWLSKEESLELHLNFI